MYTKDIYDNLIKRVPNINADSTHIHLIDLSVMILFPRILVNHTSKK